MKRVMKLLVPVCLCVMMALGVAGCSGSSSMVSVAKGTPDMVPSGVKAGDTVKFGTYYDYDIEWTVLDVQGSKALLVTTSVLSLDGHAAVERRYCPQWDYVTWEESDLRAWLNSNFLTSAFNDAQRSSIADTTVSADANPDYPDWSAGNTTTDKVFCLSVSEVQKYMPTAADRTVSGYKWWTRTPGMATAYVAYVESDGELISVGQMSDNDRTAMRPAMWVNLR